ncbi:MAG: aminopeptidase [Clostridia bacterium]|nr:aminopeptidase [Clostridia bacterium]
MTVIGITGPTGAGKSTALRALEDMGALVLDCDVVYHELLESSGEMLGEIRGAFPGAFANGRLDRKALGRIVFANESALKRLNGITHGYVRREVVTRIGEHEKKGGALAAIDAIALVEGELKNLCTCTVCVTAPAEERAKRIMKREGISYEYAMSRINAQKSDEYYMNACDHVLVNDCADAESFYLRSKELFKKLTGGDNMSDLMYKPKNAFDVVTPEEKAASDAYCEDYKRFLDRAKTEREATAEAIALAEAKGFVPYVFGDELTPGKKIYRSVRGKALFLAVVGEKPLSEGANIAAAHIDSPRLDLKQIPLYEDSEMTLFKTHYYGGIKKYQWVTIPLALHGVVVKKDGTVLSVTIGEEESDPILYITDLLPHLGKNQLNKTLGEAFSGEDLNVLIGTTPAADTKDDRFKTFTLSLLNEKYGVTEEDFLSAELEVVPAMKARDVGLDRSLIGAYGHDDRSCAFAELRAILDIGTPAKTAVCVLADKEEIGSEGVSGMQSAAFECFMEDMCETQGVKLRHCFENSFCLSADVCNAFDPNFPDVSEKRNNSRINGGMGIVKFTGSRGKAGSNDASAEIIGRLRRIFEEKGVHWQLGELGKVDQGGGGTVAMYMSKRNIDTIDAGVPVLSMHAPYELVSKLDCYMTYKGVIAVYEN